MKKLHVWRFFIKRIFYYTKEKQPQRRCDGILPSIGLGLLKKLKENLRIVDIFILSNGYKYQNWQANPY